MKTKHFFIDKNKKKCPRNPSFTSSIRSDEQSVYLFINKVEHSLFLRSLSSLLQQFTQHLIVITPTISSL